MTENELRNLMPNKLKSYLGCKEGSPAHMDIVNTYNAIKPLPQGYKLKSTDSWCAATVSAMAAKCGLLGIIPPECSCPRQIALWQKMGCWVENDAYIPKIGDVIYYDWQDSGAGDNTGVADHVGIVSAVNGNEITVIEGNKADTVAYRALKVNGMYIRGYGVPNYKAIAKEKENMPKTEAQIAVEWVKSHSIMKGYDANDFGEKDPITREQFAIVLKRLADKGYINVK